MLLVPKNNKFQDNLFFHSSIHEPSVPKFIGDKHYTCSTLQNIELKL